MQAISKILEIVIVTLIFSDVVPQLKIYAFHTFRYENLSVALLHLHSILFSFQGAVSSSFEARSQSPIP